MAVMTLSDSSLKLAASFAPNLTPVAPVKPLPLMVTVVPPPLGPWSGETFSTTGADGAAGQPFGLPWPWVLPSPSVDGKLFLHFALWPALLLDTVTPPLLFCTCRS